MSTAREVVLVGCSGPKLDHAAPARELYTGALFRKSVAYAEARGLEWIVLSALHGVVLADQLLDPYEKTLKSASRCAREEWGQKVQAELKRLFPGARFVFLAGQDYATAISGLERTRGANGRVVDRCNPLDAVEPLRGMGIGEKLAWLTGETARLDREDVERLRLEDKARRVGEPEFEQAPCDFCGEERDCAISEQGAQRFQGDDLPARICGPCATWALSILRVKAVPA